MTVAQDETLQTELVAMEGERGTVVVCGPMLTESRPGLTVYVAYSGSSRGTMAELLSAVEARHRSHRVTMTEARNDGMTETDNGSPSAQNPTKSETKSKAKSKSKKNGNI